MNDRSLRVGLLSWLGPVLALLLALDAVACYLTALYFANLAYDRWLLNDARSLAQALNSEQGRITFDLPRVALQIFYYDEVDENHFRITSEQRGYITGEASLPEISPLPINGVYIGDVTWHGKRVRVAATRIAPPNTADTITVTTATTLVKRNGLARDILVAMVLPQIALLGIATLLAWLGVSRGLKPLTDLASQIEARDHTNLSPVPQTGLPREARVLASRINELLARLGSVIRAQRQFVADAAHQLRTPLAAVMLQVERAQRATDGDTEKQALKALHRSVERAGRMTQQLLSLARTDPSAIHVVELKPLDLVTMARSVGEEWIGRALKRDIDFGLIVPDTPVAIVGDDRLLGELLSNLIDNALRYGKTSGRVSVVVEGGPQPKLAVQDDGPGIPEDERHKIFERFYRVQGSTGDGCGLGLAIVEEIARLHHAVVEVGSGPDGHGSRFIVTFRQVIATANAGR